MKKMSIVFFLMCAALMAHSQSIGSISNLTIEEFYRSVEQDPSIMDNMFLWSGVISEIRETDNALEVVVLKAKWVSLKELRASKVILRIEDDAMAEIVKKIGKFKRVSFLTRVKALDRGIYVCIPVRVYEF